MSLELSERYGEASRKLMREDSPRGDVALDTFEFFHGKGDFVTPWADVHEGFDGLDASDQKTVGTAIDDMSRRFFRW